MSTPPPRQVTLTPIGVAHTPFRKKHDAPRQAPLARGVTGTIELFDHVHPEHALQDLAAWSHLWLIFLFHENRTFHSKVSPPRSSRRRGVFATRSPHRPNPIGLSVVRLLRVEGNLLRVAELDLLEGTPILDLKPYLPYADSLRDATSGWLDDAGGDDPTPTYEVRFDARAQAQLDFLRGRAVIDVGSLARRALAAGPTPHPYRRIRKARDGAYELGLKDFRLRFAVDGLAITVLDVSSGYKARALSDPKSAPVLTDAALSPIEVHRELRSRFR